MSQLLIVALWTGAFAATFAIVFSAPLQALVPSFFAGFFARVIRDSLMGFDMSQALATLVASAAVVIVVRLTLIRRPGFSPIVVLSGLVPLGAATAFFAAIIGFLKLPSLTGEALASAPVELLSNMSALFKTTLAIVLGAALGAGMVRSMKSVRDWSAGTAGDHDSI
jgi:uncharacterized membrane protein YjjB (DUF3815 family)